MALKALLLLSEFSKGLSTIFSGGAVTRLISIVSFSPERTELIYALKLLVQMARNGSLPVIRHHIQAVD